MSWLNRPTKTRRKERYLNESIRLSMEWTKSGVILHLGYILNVSYHGISSSQYSHNLHVTIGLRTHFRSLSSNWMRDSVSGSSMVNFLKEYIGGIHTECDFIIDWIYLLLKYAISIGCLALLCGCVFVRDEMRCERLQNEMKRKRKRNEEKRKNRLFSSLNPLSLFHCINNTKW